MPKSLQSLPLLKPTAKRKPFKIHQTQKTEVHLLKEKEIIVILDDESELEKSNKKKLSHPISKNKT